MERKLASQFLSAMVEYSPGMILWQLLLVLDLCNRKVKSGILYYIFLCCLTALGFRSNFSLCMVLTATLVYIYPKGVCSTTLALLVWSLGIRYRLGQAICGSLVTGEIPLPLVAEQ